MSDPTDLLPKSIRVGPYDIRIEPVDDLDGDWGIYDPSKLLIQLERGCPDRFRLVDTVIHEINHAIWTTYGLQDSNCEEQVTTALATGWTQVYRDNPALLDWITGRLANEALPFGAHDVASGF